MGLFFGGKMKYKIITLGCKVNTYESNVIDDIMQNNGYEKIDDDNADIIIINTCTVTNTANNKSLKMIRHATSHNKNAIIIVCGCASQVYKEDILKINGVSIILGNYGKSKIIDYISEYKKNKKQIIDIQDIRNTKFETLKLNNFDKTRAFVKIQDGCNNFCSFCIIPYSRGGIRSRNREDILSEINSLITNGHSEIVLTGIHTGHYGEDNENYKLANLLKEILEIKGLKRHRISSIEITELNDDVLSILENNKILVSHLHIPLQSGTDKILKLMNRKYDTKYFAEKLEKIRKIRNDIAITTDIIVGFPGETDSDFEETMDFATKMKFAKIHVFPYSKRSGTVACNLDNQIPEEIKKERVRKMIRLSQTLEEEYMSKFINKVEELIVEVRNDEYVIGHTGNYLLVKAKYIGDKRNLMIKINKIEYPYCIGEVIDEN